MVCTNFLLCPDPTSSSPTGSISSAIMSGTSISNTSREVASASTLELDWREREGGRERERERRQGSMNVY